MNSRQLTLDDIENLPKEIFNDLGFEYVESNDDLIDMSYIIGKVTIEGESYEIIHGFPRAVVGFIKCDENYYYIGNLTGAVIDGIYDRSIEDHFTQKWYTSFTNDGTIYSDDIFFPNKPKPVEAFEQSHKLTVKDLEVFPDISCEILSKISTCFDVNDYEDFIIGNVNIGGDDWIIIHGSPRDVCGALIRKMKKYKKEGFNYEVLYIGCSKGSNYNNKYYPESNDHPAQEWYYKVTENMTNYTHQFWRGTN